MDVFVKNTGERNDGPLVRTFNVGTNPADVATSREDEVPLENADPVLAYIDDDKVADILIASRNATLSAVNGFATTAARARLRERRQLWKQREQHVRDNILSLVQNNYGLEDEVACSIRSFEHHGPISFVEVEFDSDKVGIPRCKLAVMFSSDLTPRAVGDYEPDNGVYWLSGYDELPFELPESIP